MISDEEKDELKSSIESKIHNLTCPMCQNKSFSMADGYFLNNMQKDLHSVNLGGQAIPTIGIICNNCGFVSQHALGSLGMLNKLKNKKADESSK